MQLGTGRPRPRKNIEKSTPGQCQRDLADQRITRVFTFDQRAAAGQSQLRGSAPTAKINANRVVVKMSGRDDDVLSKTFQPVPG
jgi:hypothetical protein